MNDDLNAAINNAIQITETLKKDVSKKNDGVLKEFISSLSVELSTIKSEVTSLANENGLQKNEIRRLKTKIEGAGEFKKTGEIYYTKGGDGPFCPFCHENRNRKIRLMELTEKNSDVVAYKCRMCENKFNK